MNMRADIDSASCRCQLDNKGGMELFLKFSLDLELDRKGKRFCMEILL